MPKDYVITEEKWNARLKNEYLQAVNPKTLTWEERKARIEDIQKNREGN
jgi:hypothetical protein